MHPTLIELPRLGITLGAADTFVQLAVLFCVVVGPMWAERLEGIDRRRTRRALVVLAVVVLAGGRLHYLLNNAAGYASRPLDVLKLWTGGFHIGGGIVALVLAAPRVTRAFGVPLGKFGDGIVPSIGVGIVLARIGCLLYGCCFGSLCTGPWCITFPHGSRVQQIHGLHGLAAMDAASSAPVHPLQLYFAASGLLVTAAALWLRPRKRYDGQVALVALVLFSASAAALEFLRNDFPPRAYWGPLPQLEWTALAMTAASLAGLVLAERAHRARIVADTAAA